MEYKCLACEYRFESMNEIPYCPACENEILEEIETEFFREENNEHQSHHIWPKFMSNPNGIGQQYLIPKTKHDILHGYIMKWIWEEINDLEKEQTIKIVIAKSKKFIGVNNGTV